jgi:ABC-2 type transport system ATP-binding protein
VESVVQTRREGDFGWFEVHSRGQEDLREAISVKLVSNGWPLRQLDVQRSSLEERFTQAVTQDTLAAAHLEAV